MFYIRTAYTYILCHAKDEYLASGFYFCERTSRVWYVISLSQRSYLEYSVFEYINAP